MTEVVTSTATLAQLNLLANQRQAFSVSSPNAALDPATGEATGQPTGTQPGFAQSVDQFGASTVPGQPTTGPSQPRVELTLVDFGAATAPTAPASSSSAPAPTQSPPAAAPAPQAKQAAPEQDSSIPPPSQNPLGVPEDVTGPELDIVAANVIGAAFAPFQLPAGGLKAEPAQGQRSFIFEQHKLFGEVPFAPSSTAPSSAIAVNGTKAATGNKTQTDTATSDQGGTDPTKAAAAYATTGTTAHNGKPRPASVAGVIIA